MGRRHGCRWSPGRFICPALTRLVAWFESVHSTPDEARRISRSSSPRRVALARVKSDESSTAPGRWHGSYGQCSEGRWHFSCRRVHDVATVSYRLACSRRSPPRTRWRRFSRGNYRGMNSRTPWVSGHRGECPAAGLGATHVRAAPGTDESPRRISAGTPAGACAWTPE